jgi:hypothetical protein
MQAFKSKKAICTQMKALSDAGSMHTYVGIPIETVKGEFIRILRSHTVIQKMIKTHILCVEKRMSIHTGM